MHAEIVADTIELWRLTMRLDGGDHRAVLRKAASDLFQQLKIDATVHPETHAAACQAVSAALADMAQDIPADEARRILEEAKADGANHKEGGEDNEKAEDERSERQPKQADVLVEIAESGVLFHDHENVAFIDITIKGHRETWPVRSSGFRLWLAYRYYEDNKSAPNAEAIRTALGVIESQALFDGPEHPVAVRVGGHDGRLYLDLCDKDWRAVEIDDSGWRVIDEPPIRFIRSRGMLPLPEPIKKKKTKDGIQALKSFINVKDDADFALVVAWVLAALRHHGPYPVLAFIAQHGSAKSTSLKVLRALLDPHAADLRAPPKTADDLYITAARSHLVPIDNVSSLPEWLSDALCRIATGMSYAKRMLYTDQDEVLIYAVRPIALTSIVEIIIAPDLGDRTITIVPPRIDEESRREETEVLVSFAQDHPAILAAFLDVVAHGLKMLPDVTGTRWPRMADFAKWVVACEGAYDTSGTFLEAYNENRSNAVNALLAEDMVASAVVQLVLPWEGHIGLLLEPLASLAGEQQTKSKEWPKSPRGLGSALRRLMPLLRDHGIMVEPPAKNDKTRTWSIRAVDPTPPQQPDPQPEDKSFNSQALGCLGGSGCSPLYPGGKGAAEEEKGTAEDEPVKYVSPLKKGKQQPNQPEQPEASGSSNGLSDLDAGRLSGCYQTDSPYSPPQQPDLNGQSGPPVACRVWIREIRHPAIKSGPDDDLADFV
jgi:hypothetical protein